MPEPDVRDARLGDLLDRAVAGVEPKDRSTRVVRAGRRRQAAQAVVAVTTTAVFVAAVAWAGSIAEEAAPEEPRRGSLASDGWTLEAPASWTATPIEPCEMSDGPRTGVIVSSVPFTFRDPEGGVPSCEDRFVFDGFPADGVALSYEPTGNRIGLVAQSRFDTVLPLEPGDMTSTDAIRDGPAMSYRSVVVDGDLKAFVRMWIGPEATEADVEAVRAALGSLDVAGAAHWTTSRVEGREWVPDVDLVHPDDWRVAASGGIVEDADVQSLLTLASPGVGERPCGDGSLDPRAGVVVDVGWWSGAGWGGGPEPSFPEREGAIVWNDGEASRVTCPIGQAERSTFRFTDGGLRYVVDVTLGPLAGTAVEERSTIMRIVNGVSLTAVPEGEPEIRFDGSEAPWTFRYPLGWDTRTYEAADPSFIANSLITTVASGPIPPGGPFRPNSGDPATLVAALGDGGAVVSIERFWTHGTSAVGAGEFGPGPFADDAQNPGWTFRERARCEGTLCWHVLEWLGPSVSEEDRAAAEDVADSVGLADVDRWTETDGVRTTLHDEKSGFTVAYPNAWFVADRNLIPALTEPREILSLGTFDPPFVGRELRVFDAPVAPAALGVIGPTDAFISVQESDSSFVGDRYARPDRFEDGQEPAVLALDVPFDAYWIPFVDADRGFYLFVAIGDEASPEVADQAWAIADSLRFLATPSS